MQSFSIINPYTNKITHTYCHESMADIEPKINQLSQAFLGWNASTSAEKKDAFNQLANYLNAETNNLAMMISTDMGKPVQESEKEIRKCVDCCRYFVKQMTPIQKSMVHAKGIREPLGIILSILPWNFPLWQLIRAVLPGLAAGNVFLVKPAHNTTRIAAHLQPFFNQLPHQLLQVCMASDSITEHLIGHDQIAGVSFTGSLETGKKVGALAATHMKPCVLELGGSDPFIVFEDAQLDDAISHAVQARFTNAGQVCIAAKRFLFHDTIYENAIQRFAQKTNEWAKFGNPTHPTTTIGPLARIDIKNKISRQLSDSNVAPNQVVYQQQIESPSGNAFPCMIVDGRLLDKHAPLFTEELFGPIAICDAFSDTNEAIEKANATPFGLGASIWTTSPETICTCTKAIQCGTLAINTTVHTQFDTPFGGRKQSGLGVELGMEGVHSFTGFKAILT